MLKDSRIVALSRTNHIINSVMQLCEHEKWSEREMLIMMVEELNKAYTRTREELLDKITKLPPNQIFICSGCRKEFFKSEDHSKVTMLEN